MKKVIIGTHNGIFHADEVVAIAIFKNVFGKENVEVKRSRDLKYLDSVCDLLVDIGGRNFEHHQKGGNGKREDGVSFASAGLVWKELGKFAVEKKLKDTNDIALTLNIFKDIDKNVIEYVDMEDNGEGKSNHIFSYISSFLPSWIEGSPNYDEKFNEVLDHTTDILDSVIENAVARGLAKKEINDRLNSHTCKIDNILVLPNQTIPWQDYVIDYNEGKDEGIDFVVFPYPAGGYALQCVPPSKEDMFGQRITLPKEWAGETTNLPHISGVDTATFCHKGLFFARAECYNDIVLLCNIATRKSMKEKTVRKRKID